jgi:protein-S-isoprenylcysteine O-methyltransferase Ste14
MLKRMLVTTVIMMAAMGAVLFIGAGTIHYWQAWLYLALAFACHIVMVTDLARRDPELLKRRMRAGAKAEPRSVQKIVIRLMIVLWVAMPMLAAWDRRFGWSHMPSWLNLAGAATFLAGQVLMMRVFRANTFARATVEVSEGQTLSDKGPYGVVRHPMYSSMIVLGVGVALLLGSWWALLCGLATIPVIAVRLLDEERVMLAELPGYAAYKLKVRSRLLPGVW